MDPSLSGVAATAFAEGAMFRGRRELPAWLGAAPRCDFASPEAVPPPAGDRARPLPDAPGAEALEIPEELTDSSSLLWRAQ